MITTNGMENLIGTTSSGIMYQLRYTPYAGAAGIYLPVDPDLAVPIMMSLIEGC
jgi:hypothetical protein